MASLPKLKIRKTWQPAEETRNFETAPEVLFNRGSMLVIVEGQRVDSYEELVQLASQKPYKDKKDLEVTLTPLWPAGG